MHCALQMAYISHILLMVQIINFQHLLPHTNCHAPSTTPLPKEVIRNSPFQQLPPPPPQLRAPSHLKIRLMFFFSFLIFILNYFIIHLGSVNGFAVVLQQDHFINWLMSGFFKPSTTVQTPAIVCKLKNNSCFIFQSRVSYSLHLPPLLLISPPPPSPLLGYKSYKPQQL